jgi:hypothetical protein
METRRPFVLVVDNPLAAQTTGVFSASTNPSRQRYSQLINILDNPVEDIIAGENLTASKKLRRQNIIHNYFWPSIKFLSA